MKKNINISIELLLLNEPGIVNYSKENLVEVKPNIYAPIYINIKQTLSLYNIRHILAKKLTTIISNDVDAICGIESGGTYYASIVADILNKPLILFRKNDKTCGNHNRIVGNLPLTGSKIVIIDDVIATGLAVCDAINYFQLLNKYKIEISSIFSYIPTKKIASKLGVNVRSLSDFAKLCIVAQKNKKFSEEDIGFLMEHISTYKDFKIK